MLANNFWKFGARYSLPILAAAGVSLAIVLTNIDTTPRPVSSVPPTVPLSDHTVIDPELLQFFPNRNGQPIRGSNELEVQLPGKGRSLTISMEAIDVKNDDSPSVRVVLVRNPERQISDQVISLKTDWLEHFPEKALISEVDSDGNRGLFIPVEAGMRFVRYLIVKWDSASERFIPLKRGAEVFPIEIDGEVVKTATLINPQVEDDALLYESHASGSGPEFVRCSRVVKDGFQTIFEGNYNDIKNGVAGDWQLEISQPIAKTNRKSSQTRMVKTAVFSSAQIGFDSPGWNCSDWLEKLRSLKKPAN